MMAAVSLRAVVKSFGAVRVIQDVDLEIGDGEFVVLVGPSGCGKSTLLRMVAGLETINSGEVLIGGEIVNDMSPKERNIAMVFQSYALYPHMTVRENLGFSLKLSRAPRAGIVPGRDGQRIRLHNDPRLEVLRRGAQGA